MSVKKIELIRRYQSIRSLVLKLQDRLVVALCRLSWVFSPSVFLAVPIFSGKTLDRVSADTPFGGAACVAPARKWMGNMKSTYVGAFSCNFDCNFDSNF